MHISRRSLAVSTIIALLIAITTLTATASTPGNQFAFLDQVKEYLGNVSNSTALVATGEPQATGNGPLAPAAVLLSWNTFGNAGTETTEPSVANDPNLSATNLTLGSVTPAANANRLGGSNWFDTGDTNPTTLAESVTGNDYIQFVVTPNAGFSFTPTSFVFGWDHSGTGPGSLTLRSSVDNFATDLGTVTGLAASQTNGNTINISGLTALTSATTFRLYGYGATAAGGVGGFDTATNAVNVVLNGSTASASGLTPPTLTAASGATVDNNFNITFTDDPTWRGAVTVVKCGASTLTVSTDYTLTAGVLTLKPGGGNTCLQTAGTPTITITATGYTDASVVQVIAPGVATNLAITTQPTAPASNGSALGVQPVVRVRDQYNNTVTNSAASIIATPAQGSWTLGGTTTVSASSGVATFSGLTATSAAAVTGATINFTSSGLTGVTSNAFNIPAPSATEPTVQASNVVVSNVTGTSFTASWTPGDGSSRLVTVRPFGVTASAPVAGTTYTPNSVFGSGATTATNNYVVFAGSGNSVTVTGLTPGMQYLVNVYEFNGSGGTENYLTTSPATGSATTSSIVAWNFPNSPDDATADNGTAANLSKTISTSGGTSAVDFATSGATTRAANATAWNSGSGTKWWEISMVTTGYSSLQLWSKQRSSGTGPRDFKVQYSTDHATWFDVSGSTVAITSTDFTTGVLSGVALPTAAENQPIVYLRWIMTSNTSENNGTVASGGTSQIDDIGIVGSVTTGAEVSVSGRVVTAGGNGIQNAVITVSGTGTGVRMSTMTGPFGYFSMGGLDAGDTYVITVQSKRFTFANPNRVVTLNDSVDDILFTANP
jgi:Carboxypeptidase regulatory-like domain/Fibronectin type III domain/Protein of unknown function (DUF1533)